MNFKVGNKVRIVYGRGPHSGHGYSVGQAVFLHKKLISNSEGVRWSTKKELSGKPSFWVYEWEIVSIVPEPEMIPDHRPRAIRIGALDE